MCVLLLLALAAPVQAIPITFGDIEITAEPPPKGGSSHGYSEYVFHVVNKSKERSHIVSLSIPFERSFAPGDSIRELRRTVQVGANESVRVSLLQPDHPPVGGTDAAVAIDGRRQDRDVQLRVNQSSRSFHSYSRRYFPPSGSVEPLILLGLGVKLLPEMAPAPSAVTGGAAMPPGGAGPAGMPPLPGAMRPPASPTLDLPLVLTREEMLEELLLPPLGWNGPAKLGTYAQLLLVQQQMGEVALSPSKPGLPPHGLQFVTAETWSTNWLAYSRYDGIIIAAAELNALPVGIRTALWQYVETGGSLLVLGRADLRGLSAVSSTKQIKAGWLAVQAGFGTCHVNLDANYETWDAEDFSRFVTIWKSNASMWTGGSRNTLDANKEFPVIDDLGVPVKGLFVLMFLFALAIGPVNLLVLSRLKRRIWLLWTTPAVSLCTCLAVFGFMLVSEGWSGQLKNWTLTLLDETTHRATTLGCTGVYSPLTPSDGLHFRYETEVIPQRFFEGMYSGARSCTIDWSQDQHFAAGWVEARVPALFKVRKSELRRERVSLQREQDGRWNMVNGLGAPIRRFWCADAKGQIYMAENVAAGARAVLTQTEQESLASKPIGENILSSLSWMAKMKDLTDHPEHYLLPGIYLAEVDDSPFLEVALPNARTRQLHALVLGFPSN